MLLSMSLFYARRFFLFLWIYQGCGNVHVPMVLNTKLAPYYVLEVNFDGTLHRCANKCVYKTDCQSVSFTKETSTCEFYRVNSTSVTSGDKSWKSQTVLLDIGNWPQSRTGACWNKPCAEKMKCVPHGTSYRCHEDEEFGCKPYVLPENGVLLDIYGHLGMITGELNPIGTAIALNCEAPYFTLVGKPDIYWLSRCQTDQTWSILYSCYTVEELCTDAILEAFYPAHAEITATSAIPFWDETELFLSSYTGWIPASTDSQQYFQVLFDAKYQLGGVLTQGGENGDFVTTFRINYSSNCVNYFWMMEADNEFPGNNDAINVVPHYFDKPTAIRCMKIYPTGFEGGIAIRFEVLACDNYNYRY